MELKEMIKIMQHFENSGEVEFKRTHENDTGGEKLLPVPVWNWERFNYRIKPEKQKVTIEKWLCRDNQEDFIIFETSNVDKNRQLQKIKFIESYEVEL